MPRKSKLPEVPAAQRVSRAVDLLVSGSRPTRVAETIAKEFGIHERTAWGVVHVAQDDLAKSFQRDLPRLKEKLWGYFNRLMEKADKRNDIRGGVAAASALAKLCGADAPNRVEVSGAAGVLVVTAVPESAEEWAAAQEKKR